MPAQWMKGPALGRIDEDMKQKLRIYGSERLEGDVMVSGGKNAARGGNSLAQNQVVQAAWQIAEPALEGLGFELVDVEFVKEAKCVVFGSPIYAAHITGQMMNYLLFLQLKIRRFRFHPQFLLR